MKLGLIVGHMNAPGGAKIIELAQETEALGYDTIWCAEIYGTDCFTPLTWIGAHTSLLSAHAGIYIYIYIYRSEGFP